MSDLMSVHTDGAPGAIGPYSQAVVCGDMLYTSGQVALDPSTGQMVSGGVEAQAERVLSNLQAVLEAGGSSLDRVVKTTVYLADMEDFAAVNAVYAQRFGEARPARATVQVSRLPKDALVEIDAVAVRG